MPVTFALVTSPPTNNILKYDINTGAYVGVFASDLFKPTGMVIGPDGKVYVTNNGSSVRSVVRYNTDGTNQFTFASDPSMKELEGIAFDASGKLYVANDEFANNVLRFNADGSFDRIFATGNDLVAPSGLKIGVDGKLYVVSKGNNKGVLRWNADGTFDTQFLAVTAPEDLIQDGSNNWCVSSTDKKSVLRFSSAGAYQGILATAGGIEYPTGLAFAPDGKLYVANVRWFTPDGEWYGSSVLRYTGTSGAFDRVICSGGFLNSPFAIAFV